ncbi:MAG: hypothetical protein ACYSR9_01890 [Planctomycetota bacterium]|jgi:hypothetical protein
MSFSGRGTVHAIQPLQHGSFLIAGKIRRSKKGGAKKNDDSLAYLDDFLGKAKGVDGWVVKLDKNHKVVWKETFGGKRSVYVNAISPHPKGFVLAGGTGSGPENFRGWVLSIDASGKTIK